MPSPKDLRLPQSATCRVRENGGPAAVRPAVSKRSWRAGLAGTALALILGAVPSGQAAAQQTVARQTADEGFAGPYLAAREASATSDYTAAAKYYAEALKAAPGDPALLESAVIANLALGDLEAALPFAEKLSGQHSQIANLVVLAHDAKTGDFDAVIDALNAGPDDGPGAGPLVEGLLRAWAELARGRMSEATDAFDSVAKLSGMAPFGLYHKALALALAGDFEGSDKILSGDGTGPLRLTRRGLITHAEVLSQLDHNDAALKLLSGHFGGEPDPTLEKMRAELKAGKTLPFTAVTSATDGMAEVFYSVAGALSGDKQDAFTLSYARLADYLRPDHDDAILLIAALLERQGQFQLATKAYNRIPRDNPSYPIAELGRADALVDAGQPEQAVEVLQQLGRSYPDQAVVWATLGDTLRRQEHYADAAKAYDSAIKLFGEDQRGQWTVYYARGICHERTGDFAASEKDMRKALELSPDQPQVLNYLGYSFLEQGQNLDEALDMIKKAVAARPKDGYIVDSLGWALYRMGKYQEAVPKMEQAVELMSSDPVINDHLGDVYWAVGRHREAEFQWHRALSFDPEDPKEADRIRRKLEVGLDKVLAEEGKEPLSATHADASGDKSTHAD